MSHYKKSFSKSKESDIRSTPQCLFGYWQNIFNFTLDVCATPDNAKCGHFYTEKDNGLVKNWHLVNWCNPPYSSGQIDLWLRKGKIEQELGNTTVFLLPCDTSTKWYHDNIACNNQCSIIPVKGRVKFNGAKYNSPFGSSIIIFWGVNYIPNKTESTE